ncbi:tail fiber domain-containing protein [Pantoea ananatis]|uniref:tail fiber domain-containing protein n=1 Tax=Pantoea ananas TaxID=553 RepID=UPI001B3172C7|nr:tail fiber domain-containing protein [Pantoea ananatis]
MPAGTIALTNKSTTVSGTGTSFTTELKAGDFVYVNVGGAPYTLVAANVTSDTQLTLAVAFDGPTSSGLAWNAVPASLQVAITQKILNDFASVARGRILDFQNWQKIYSDEQTVTVTRPDRSQFTGPSWGYMAAQYANKLDKSALDAYAKNGANNDITGLSGLTTALSIEQGGTGAKTKADAWKALATFGNSAGTAAQGNDSRLDTVNQKTGGVITSDVQVRVLNSFQSGGTTVNQSGRMQLQMPNGNQPDVAEFMTERVVGGAASLVIHHKTDFSDNYWKFNTNGAVNSPGPWNVTSDERHKTNIKAVTNPLSAVMSWRGCTFDKKDYGHDIGLIAQDVEKWCPTAVTSGGRREFLDGTSIDDLKVLNITGVAAAYHTEAIKALFSLIELAIADPDKALKHIDQIKSSVVPPDSSS